MLAPPETMNDDRIVAKCYVELGNVTLEKGEYDESLRYHRKSMEIFERIDDPLSVADSHLNIADVYKAKGELKSAMSEYEKGLTLYEDVFVEDPAKNSDSGTDVSLNSSSFSDLQHARALSKSDETLPVTSMLDEQKRSSPSTSPPQSSGLKHASTGSLNVLARSSEDVSLMGATSETRLRTSSENDIDQFFPTLPSSHSLDIDQLSPSDETAAELTSAHEDTSLICAPLLCSLDTLNVERPQTKFDARNDQTQPDNTPVHTQLKEKGQSHDTRRWWRRISTKQWLIVIPSVFLIGALLWSTGDLSTIPSFSQPSEQRHTRSTNSDDLGEQLRKIVAWRNDQMRSLSKATRKTVEEFVRGSESRSKMTIDKFQRMLETLDLKIVLVPR